MVEIFGGPNNDVIRYHVALLEEPQASPPSRKGRSMVTVGSSSFYIDDDEMQVLRPFLDNLTEASAPPGNCAREVVGGRRPAGSYR